MPKQMTPKGLPKSTPKAPKNPTLAAKRPNKAPPKPMPFSKGGKVGMKGYC